MLYDGMLFKWHNELGIVLSPSLGYVDTLPIVQWHIV